MGEIIFGSIVVLISLLFLGNIAVTVGFLTKSGEVGAGTWPALLLGLILLLGLVNLGIQIHKFRVSRGDSKVDNESEAPSNLLKSKLMISAIVLFAYVFLLDKIGFLFSTPLFLLAYMIILGQKKRSIRIIVALATTIILYVLFARFLMIPLPRGYGIFRSISLAIETL